MDSQDSKISVLIIGAFGQLGHFITKHCLLQPNLQVNILVRDPKKNQELSSQVVKAGGRVIQGDIATPGSVKGVTKGIHTLIFSLPALSEDVMVNGQIRIIKDGIENGVQRVVPSEFFENPDKLSDEEIEKIGVKGRFVVREFLKNSPIKALHINTGLFLDSYFQFIVGKAFEYWGDDHKMQLTSIEDTARIVAAAVAKKERSGHVVYIGNEVTITETAQIYNKIRGTSFVPKKLGSLDDLKKKAEDMEKQGDPYAWLYKFLTFIFDERSLFEKNNNDEFPEIKATTVEQLLKEKTEINVNQ